MPYATALGVERTRRRIEQILTEQGTRADSTAQRLLAAGTLQPYFRIVVSELPVRTGRLRNSFVWRLKGRLMDMKLTVPYASAPNLIGKYGDYFERAVRSNLGVFKRPAARFVRYDRYPRPRATIQFRRGKAVTNERSLREQRRHRRLVEEKAIARRWYVGEPTSRGLFRQPSRPLPPTSRDRRQLRLRL